MKILLIFTLFSLLVSACTPAPSALPTTAEIESAGMRAMHGQQDEAFQHLRIWAKQGNPQAQRELGLALSAKTDQYPEAIHWLEQAAKGGDAQAQFAVAEANYKSGLGLTQNFTLAWQWYERAANQHHPKASFMLARMAKYGEGTRQDLQTSVHWLQIASDQGNAQAMFLLSNAYAAGEGVQVNPQKAREWLERSAEGDYPVAIHALALELSGSTENRPTDLQTSRHLIKEASDERLLRWNRYQ